MFVVGLTGGIASGKSTVGRLFARRGIPVLDADVAAREVVEPGAIGLERLVQAFGPGVIDAGGRLDRAALRGRVFADPSTREHLEAILHPLIRERLSDQLAALDAPYALLEAPLLIEAGFTDLVARILVVDVAEEVQVRRVMARDAVPREQAEAVLAAQASREHRLAHAHDVIVNDTDLAALETAVERLHRRYLKLAAGDTRIEPSQAVRDNGPPESP